MMNNILHEAFCHSELDNNEIKIENHRVFGKLNFGPQPQIHKCGEIQWKSSAKAPQTTLKSLKSM